MKTVLLVTCDDGLASRLAHTLGTDGAVVRCEPGVPLPRPLDARTSLVVWDCREIAGSGVPTVLEMYRLHVGSPVRCVAIARLQDAIRIKILTTLNHEVLDVIFPAIDEVEELVRAHLNDRTRSTAAASVLQLLLRLLPPPTHETLCDVLGTGFRVSSVKQLATYHQKERTTIGKALRPLTSWTPKQLVDVCKGSYAVTLLRDVRLSRAETSCAVCYCSEVSLDGLLTKVFEKTSLCIQHENCVEDSGAWLERHLTRYIGQRGVRTR